MSFDVLFLTLRFLFADFIYCATFRRLYAISLIISMLFSSSSFTLRHYAMLDATCLLIIYAAMCALRHAAMLSSLHAAEMRLLIIDDILSC